MAGIAKYPETNDRLFRWFFCFSVGVAVLPFCARSTSGSTMGRTRDIRQRNPAGKENTVMGHTVSVSGPSVFPRNVSLLRSSFFPGSLFCFHLTYFYEERKIEDLCKREP